MKMLTMCSVAVVIGVIASAISDTFPSGCIATGLVLTINDIIDRVSA